MKLCTYDHGEGPRAGVVLGERVLDATALLGHPAILQDVQALLELQGNALNDLRLAADGASPSEGKALSSVRLRPPVLRPPTVRDFMVYEGHATRGGTRKQVDAWYRMPIFYFSNPLRVFGPEDEIPYPSATEVLDYELEIAVVIGREGSNVPEANWLDYVAGFTILNDWSCRDLQRDEQTANLGPAKGKDSATSLGPVLVTPDELNIADGVLHTRCNLKVNGVEWMANDTGIAYHSWGSMIERASRDSRIVPGDVLGSGTVTGGSIGEAIRDLHKPARFLQPGDLVEIEVEGIGILRNTIGPKVGDDPNYRFRAAPGAFEMPTPSPR